MNKELYLSELEQELMKCTIKDKDKYLEYYEELIADYIEDGKSEEETISLLDSPKEVVMNIMYDQKEVSIKRPKGKLGTLTIVLLVLGAPLWLSLIAVVFCFILVAILLVFIFYFLLWLVPALLATFVVTFAVVGIYGVFGSIPFMYFDFMPGFMQLGIGVFFTGLTILCFYALKYTFNSFSKTSRKLGRKIKYLIKERVIRYEFKYK